MPHKPASDFPFYAVLAIITGAYLLLVVSLLAADVAYLFQASGTRGDAVVHGGEATRANPVWRALSDRHIQSSIRLSLFSTTVTTALSLLVAVPAGYLLSRHTFFGRNFVDAVLDIPFVLPPLVVGLSLLILFQYLPRAWHDAVVYGVPAVIMAQAVVACALAIRVMRATYDQIDPRREQVALTLGASRWQAFNRVALPEAATGILAAGTLAWARALGEFGPLLVFAGVTRGKTEVLSTSVYLELSIGNLEGAVAVSLLMIAAAVAVLMVTRRWGARHLRI